MTLAVRRWPLAVLFLALPALADTSATKPPTLRVTNGCRRGSAGTEASAGRAIAVSGGGLTLPRKSLR